MDILTFTEKFGNVLQRSEVTTNTWRVGVCYDSYESQHLKQLYGKTRADRPMAQRRLFVVITSSNLLLPTQHSSTIFCAHSHLYSAGPHARTHARRNSRHLTRVDASADSAASSHASYGLTSAYTWKTREKKRRTKGETHNKNEVPAITNSAWPRER